MYLFQILLRTVLLERVGVLRLELKFVDCFNFGRYPVPEYSGVRSSG
jgi:hypothetical protein